MLWWTFCVNNEQDAQLLQRKRHAFGSEFRSASEFISRSGSGTGTRIWTPCRNQTKTRIPVHAWSFLCIISASCIDHQLWLGLRRLECSLPGGGKHCVNSVIPYYTLVPVAVRLVYLTVRSFKSAEHFPPACAIVCRRVGLRSNVNWKRVASGNDEHRTDPPWRRCVFFASLHRRQDLRLVRSA